LRRFLPYDWGVPSGRWLNLLMNRINPDLFAACFLSWVRECWPASPDTIAIDGKTVRRSHDRSAARAALHLISAFASDTHLVLGQEAVDDKSNETAAIPVLLEKLAVGRSLQGALVTIDAIACNPAIAGVIRDVGADYLLAVKGNQPTLQADIEAAFQTAEAKDIEVAPDIDKGHGRIETRLVSVMRQVDWLNGDRRFPGELRFPDACAIVRIDQDRVQRPLPLRRATLHHLKRPLRSPARRGLPRPLGDREQAALDARRDSSGGFLARA
jgi:predicted transposase YbfD/YdcC